MAPDMLQGMWFYGLPLGQDCHAAHGIGLSAYCQPAVAEYSVLVESSEDGLHKVAGTGDSTKKRKAGSKEEDSDTANAKKKKKKLAPEETEALEHSDNNTKKKEGLRESSHSKAASEQPKTEYIHVRARRGQATDSHSLAERVRREKIGERMKYLQDLVPGCNNITGKASVLDEIINYVQSLQKQVQFLSMKLAAADPLTDFNMHSFVEKEVCGSSAWDYNLQELYNKMDIARGRVNAFPFHLHQGGDNRV